MVNRIVIGCCVLAGVLEAYLRLDASPSAALEASVRWQQGSLLALAVVVVLAGAALSASRSRPTR